MAAKKKRVQPRPSARRTPTALPSWDDVRFFLAIQRAGSLSRAAHSLEVTQPTCGRRLAALEASLGLRLFDRLPEGLRLTREGASLLEAATRMEQSAHDLALTAAVEDRDLEGVVRIGTTEAFAHAALIEVLARIRERYPGIRTELVLSNSEADLLRREADIAIRFRPEGLRPTPDTLVAARLNDEPHALYAAEGYLRRRGTPSDPSALAGHDVVVYTGPHPAAKWCERAYVGTSVVLAAPSMHVVGAAIAASLGLGVVPARLSRVFPELRRISPVVARGTGWVVVHPDLRSVPRIRVVIDNLVAMMRADRIVA